MWFLIIYIHFVLMTHVYSLSIFWVCVVNLLSLWYVQLVLLPNNQFKLYFYLLYLYGISIEYMSSFIITGDIQMSLNMKSDGISTNIFSVPIWRIMQ